MKFFALVVLTAAWACVFLAPKTTWSRIIQFLIFGALGAVFTLAGGFSYWWDSGMRPSQKSPFLLICGALTLAAQAMTVLRGVLENEGGAPWPERRIKRANSNPPARNGSSDA